MSYQCWIRVLGYSESVRTVNPVGVNEDDRKAARGREKMKFDDRCEHTAKGVRTRAGERGGDTKGIVTKGARRPRLTLLRRQASPLKYELSQRGQQETERGGCTRRDRIRDD
eukprot:4611580-Pleurochrysis_carterae.AAC.2